MDSASRGAWGSFLLLVLSRPSFTSALGALALILSLVSGLSTQLIVQYPTQAVKINDTASLGYCQGYQSFEAGEDQAPAIPTGNLIQSYYNGLYSSAGAEFTSTIPVSCPTGNCTWPNVTTIGICSACTNLTASIVDISMEVYNTTDDSVYYRAYQIGNTDHWFLSIPVAGQSTIGSDNPNIIGQFYFNATQSNAISFFDLANYTFMGAIPGKQPWAWECALYLCSQTIETITVNHATLQNITSTYRNTTTADITYGAELVYPANNITLQEETGLYTDTSTWQAIKSLFPDSAFTGSVGTDSDYEISYMGGPATRMLYRAAFGGQVPSAGGPTTNYTGVNIPLVFAQIATSMTNDIRTEVNDKTYAHGQILAAGQATTTIRFVHIRWIWVVIPIVVLILTIVFLGAVIWQNSRVKAVLWKSNALAVLAIDGGVGHNLRVCRNTESLTKKAKNMEVTMKKERGTGREKYVLRETGF